MRLKALTVRTEASPQRLALVACVAVALTLPLASRAQPAAAPAKTPSAAKAPASGPAWSELSKSQHVALAPLGGIWSSMSEPHKRKWIALSANYDSMQPEEQARLHGRMKDWGVLSPQQRAQARLNFEQTRKIDPEEKKAKWEAYQALTPEEKKKLAAQAPRPKGAAIAVKPVAPQKLATVPTPKADARHSARIASGQDHASDAQSTSNSLTAPSSSQ